MSVVMSMHSACRILADCRGIEKSETRQGIRIATMVLPDYFPLLLFELLPDLEPINDQWTLSLSQSSFSTI